MIFQKGFHADVGEGSVKSFHSLARISSLDDSKCFDLNTGIMFQVIEIDLATFYPFVFASSTFFVCKSGTQGSQATQRSHFRSDFVRLWNIR